MTYTFDLDSDSLYVEFREGETAGQIELPSGLIVDVDAAHQALGVEVLRASAGWEPGEVIQAFEIPPVDAASLRWLASGVLYSPGLALRFRPTSETPSLAEPRPISDLEADTRFAAA